MPMMTLTWAACHAAAQHGMQCLCLPLGVCGWSRCQCACMQPVCTWTVVWRRTHRLHGETLCLQPKLDYGSIGMDPLKLQMGAGVHGALHELSTWAQQHGSEAAVAHSTAHGHAWDQQPVSDVAGRRSLDVGIAGSLDVGTACWQACAHGLMQHASSTGHHCSSAPHWGQLCRGPRL